MKKKLQNFIILFANQKLLQNQQADIKYDEIGIPFSFKDNLPPKKETNQ